MSQTQELIVRREGVAGFLTLNRPKAIHALTIAMDHGMMEALKEWRDDGSVSAVILDHSEGRGFCAGGDIAFLRQSALTDEGVSGRKFFYEEYQLNHLMFTYTKPIVAFMDGITMGGGVGISQPARYRIATENTRYAMPEAGIGLFPDVGGGWYLARLAGRLGQYLALTGARLDGADCIWAGLCTHYVPQSALAEAKSRIAAGEAIDVVLRDLAIEAPTSKVAAAADQIAQHFASNTLEEIITSLENDTGEWAINALRTLRTRSPQACKVALRQLTESAALEDFADNMALEYRIASRVLTLPDFAEGVRSVIVDKDNAPRWNPATPEGVTQERIDTIFADLPIEEEWKPLAF